MERLVRLLTRHKTCELQLFQFIQFIILTTQYIPTLFPDLKII